MKIILINQKTKTRKEFTQDEISIGRDKNCDFTTPPEEGYISRHHCTIIQNENGVSIRDDGSKNRTIVRGKKLSKDEHAALSDGDTIELGKDYILKVSIKDDDNTSSKPTPTDQTPPEEEEIKLTPEDNDIEELSDSALGLNVGDDKKDEPLEKPSAAEIEDDLAKPTEEKKKEE